MRNPTPLAKDDALTLAPGATCKRIESQGAAVYVIYREDGTKVAVASNASGAWRRALERLKREVGQGS